MGRKKEEQENKVHIRFRHSNLSGESSTEQT